MQGPNRRQSRRHRGQYRDGHGQVHRAKGNHAAHHQACYSQHSSGGTARHQTRAIGCTIPAQVYWGRLAHIQRYQDQYCAGAAARRLGRLVGALRPVLHDALHRFRWFHGQRPRQNSARRTGQWNLPAPARDCWGMRPNLACAMDQRPDWRARLVAHFVQCLLQQRG